MAFDATKPVNSSAMVAAELRTNFAACVRPLTASTSAAQCTSTTETDLLTFSVPGSTLAATGEALDFVGQGYFAANGNTKTLKLYLGASSVTVASGAYNSGRWEVRARIVRTGAATQVVPYVVSINGQYPVMGTGTLATMAATLSSANTVKLTGQGGATGDIVQEYLAVGLIPSP